MLAAFASAFSAYEAAGGGDAAGHAGTAERGRAHAELSALRRTSRQARSAGRQLVDDLEGGPDEAAGEESERGA